MEVLKNIGTGAKAGWSQLSRMKRTGIVSLLTLTLLLGSVLAYYTQRVEYTLLFSGIEEADAGKIVEDLETNKIAYKLEDKGTTIMIDKKYVDKYRIGLAVNDMLPSNATGFEIFDTTSMMATDEDRQISYQRAIQGELQRAIVTLDGVATAQVLLSLPEESVFTRPGDISEASASVMLTTLNGRVLPSSTIEGIAALISGAVENLPIQNVKIMDSKGNLLSAFLQAGEGTTGADLSARNQQIKREYEQSLEQKLLQTLAPIYGVDNLTVSVNVEMDFDAIEEENVTYGEDHVRSQTVSASGGEINSDILNGSANDGATAAVKEGEDGNSASYSSTTNNELDTTTTKRVKAPGEVTKTTASVLYNSGIPGPGKSELESLVKNAIGAETVVAMPTNFASPAAGETEAADPESGTQAFLNKYMSYILLGSGIFILGVIMATILHSINRKRRERNEWDDEMDYQQEEASLSKEQELENIQNLLHNDKVQKEQDVHKYAKDNPELVADLIKMWMKDEK